MMGICVECENPIDDDPRFHIEPWEDATDPEGFHTEKWKAEYFGCICNWEWKQTGHRSGHNAREQIANCPYHRVMY